ncbi:hypothetical protein WSS15_27170 [Acetobacter pasteurianus]|nr:hypothetical protein WSS15_27170 [Acetobacter pasteurianus]
MILLFSLVERNYLWNGNRQTQSDISADSRQSMLTIAKQVPEKRHIACASIRDVIWSYR